MAHTLKWKIGMLIAWILFFLGFTETMIMYLQMALFFIFFDFIAVLYLVMLNE